MSRSRAHGAKVDRIGQVAARQPSSSKPTHLASRAKPAPKKARIPAAPRVSAKSVRLALIEQGGNVSAVAEAFRVARQTVYNWIERYKLRDLVELSRDTM